jgi:hypothetical protein
VETFVVQVFVPAGDEKLKLTGVVEHSGTGCLEQSRGSKGLLGVVVHPLELGHEAVESGDNEREEER